jgi:hypothetical protein
MGDHSGLQDSTDFVGAVDGAIGAAFHGRAL